MSALNLTKQQRNNVVDVKTSLDSGVNGTGGAVTWDMERNLALQAMHAALLQQQWLQNNGDHHQLLQQQQQQQQQFLLQQSLASVGMWPTQTPVHSLVQQSCSVADTLRIELEKRLATFLAEVGTNFKTASTSSAHSLRRDGRCEWPQCSAPVENIGAMADHLQQCHSLSVETLAAAQLQLIITRHLEERAAMEASRLSAMLSHLSELSSTSSSQNLQSFQKQESPVYINGLFNGTSGSSPSPGPIQHRFRSIDSNSKMSPIMSAHGLGLNCNDLTKNRAFYRQSTDVRPPFTYAALIRQSIVESSQRQLTLNEIYQWFQSEFAYFRRNEATWKNAVRHNLSLHKCFMRVENVKGAVWTVDESEFLRRRPQRLGSGGGTSVTSTCAKIKEEPTFGSMAAAAAAVESQAQLLAARAAGNLTSGGVMTQRPHCESPLESVATSPDSSGAPEFRSLHYVDGFQLPTSCSPEELTNQIAHRDSSSFCADGTADDASETLWNMPLCKVADEMLLSHSNSC